jgi:hypothetical protein
MRLFCLKSMEKTFRQRVDSDAFARAPDRRA